MNDVYELENKLLTSEDILEFSDILINLSDIIYEKKNKKTLINNFTETLYQYAFCEDLAHVLEPKTDYVIMINNRALIRNLVNNVHTTTPVKTLKEWRAFAETNKRIYGASNGNMLDKTTVEQFLECLEERYQFLSVVFASHFIHILLINNVNVNMDGVTIQGVTGTGKVEYEIELYCTRGDLSPIHVLAHELGHVILSEFEGKINHISPKIIDRLDLNGTLGELELEEQLEIAADLMAVGLLYGGPYENESYFRKDLSDEQCLKLQRGVIEIINDIKSTKQI